MFHFSGSRVHKPMDSAYDDRVLTLSGYPIRTPPGLSSLAALRGFSQLVASFFACQHQGIHHKPLGSLYKVKPLVTRSFLNLSRVRFSSLRICYFFVCLILFCNLCVSALHLEIVFPTKLLEYQSCDWYLSFCHADVNLPPSGVLLAYIIERVIRLVGLEPTTPRLSSACSNQLSYSRVDVEGKDRDSCRRLRFRGVDLRMLYPLTP